MKLFSLPIRKKTSSVGYETLSVSLAPLSCSSCATNLDLALEDIEGIESANTSYAKNRCTITFNPTQISVKAIFKALNQLGYSSIDK